MTFPGFTLKYVIDSKPERKQDNQLVLTPFEHHHCQQ